MSISLMPRGEEMVDVAGTAVVLHHGDPGAEYHIMRHGALLVDRSHRGRAIFDGEKARETLTGLVTNDVLSLEAGHGQFAAALTPKGKVISEVRIEALAADRLLVDVPVRAADGWWAMLRKFVNPRLVQWRDITATWRHLTLSGPEARGIIGRVTGVATEVLDALTPYGVRVISIDGAEAFLSRSPELGIETWDIWIAIEGADALRAKILQAGAFPGGLIAWEIIRVEQGFPEWGLDIDDATIPQEANLDDWHALSYTKGCYTGQETVARVHFRGHVNRHLRGLRFDYSEPLPRGAQLFDNEGKPLGDVRSTVVSPRLGPIALGMVRREVAIGSVLVGRAPGGLECPVLVHALPFAAH